jgi:BCD family chlorophyll transporter-like MFS transporter
MNLAPVDQRGLALGAWGAVQASAAGLAVALGGIIRDLVARLYAHAGGLASATLAGSVRGYTFVYTTEIVLLFATVVAMAPLIRRLRQPLPA